MLIVMDAHASAEQIKQVCHMIAELGYVPHAMPGPTRTAIGITGNQHQKTMFLGGTPGTLWVWVPGPSKPPAWQTTA